MTPPTSQIAPGSWAETFAAFTPHHAVVVAVCGVVMAGVITAGRSLRDGPGERRLRYTIAWLTIAWQIAAMVYWFLPSRFDITESLPLHVCDIAAWAAPLALLTRVRTLRLIAYAWGFGLSTQAFIQPVLTQGYTHPEYWLFWVGHTQIVGIALYDLIVSGFRPRPIDYLRITIANIVYLSFVTVVNLPLDTNYGYVGRTLPAAKTVLNVLGDWPQRAILLGLIVQAWHAAIIFPWALVPNRRRAGNQAQPEPTP